MNTNPDETTLALWLDDELHGEELAAVEAWAASHPEQLAAREEVRRWREMVASAMPAAEEPPAAEFFNARIAHAIQEPAAEPANVAKRRISWRSVLMPLAACAGMALTFWLGVKMNSGVPEIDVAGRAEGDPGRTDRLHAGARSEGRVVRKLRGLGHGHRAGWRRGDSGLHGFLGHRLRRSRAGNRLHRRCRFAENRTPTL